MITTTTGRTIAVTVTGVYSSLGSSNRCLQDIGIQSDRNMYSTLQ